MDNFDEMARLFLQCTGQFLTVTFESQKNPAAAHKGRTLVKRTTGVFRAGVQFANLGAVKEGIEAGERGEVEPLPWGKWVQYPYIISHKGEYYIRLYPPFVRDHHGDLVPHWRPGQIRVEYTVDGNPATKDEFNSFLTPSEARASGEVPQCFTVKARNVISIG